MLHHLYCNLSSLTKSLFVSLLINCSFLRNLHPICLVYFSLKLFGMLSVCVISCKTQRSGYQPLYAWAASGHQDPPPQLVSLDLLTVYVLLYRHLWSFVVQMKVLLNNCIFFIQTSSQMMGEFSSMKINTNVMILLLWKGKKIIIFLKFYSKHCSLSFLCRIRDSAKKNTFLNCKSHWAISVLCTYRFKDKSLEREGP